MLHYIPIFFLPYRTDPSIQKMIAVMKWISRTCTILYETSIEKSNSDSINPDIYGQNCWEAPKDLQVKWMAEVCDSTLLYQCLLVVPLTSSVTSPALTVQHSAPVQPVPVWREDCDKWYLTHRAWSVYTAHCTCTQYRRGGKIQIYIIKLSFKI